MRTQAALPPAYIYEGANPGNKNTGKGLFLKHCAECHGEDGKGISAPGLNNQEFLNAASNGYIMATMTLGRKDTRMPSWGYPGEDHPVLTPEERKDITAWIRSWQRIKIGF